MRRVAGSIAELDLELMAPSPTTRGTCQQETVIELQFSHFILN